MQAEFLVGRLFKKHKVVTQSDYLEYNLLEMQRELRSKPNFQVFLKPQKKKQQVVDEMDSPPYTGIPAPTTLTEDPWFGPAVVSDANKDYMEREYEAFKQDALNYYSDSKEPENIHQVMYEMATQNAATTLQLDPIG